MVASKSVCVCVSCLLKMASYSEIAVFATMIVDATVILSWTSQISGKSNIEKTEEAKRKANVKMVTEMALIPHKPKNDGSHQEVGHSKVNFFPRV